MKIYYDYQTKKAIRNFPFTSRATPKDFLYAIVEIKKAAAIAHRTVHELKGTRAQAIIRACDEILAGQFDDQFVLPAFQGGAGTSNHMNVNEVIATRATELAAQGHKKIVIHPNDHVNRSHSTNDVMPSALRIAAIRRTHSLLATVKELVKVFHKKAEQFRSIQKLGRTHMQDAAPITVGSEFKAYGDVIKRGGRRVEAALQPLFELNLGGSAVGNSINASPKYIRALYPQLKKITELPIKPADNFMPLTSSSSDFVAFSQSLTALCTDLTKIAHDLRFLSSGPKGGIGEIHLPELQPGSSIMPGKVNPIMPEALTQLYCLVSGNNLTIELAAQSAQLEMAVFLPIITDRLLESIQMMDEMLRQFAMACVAGIIADKKRCRELLERSTAFGVGLSPRLGYEAVASAVKEAVRSGKTLRRVIIERRLLTNKQFNALVKSAMK
ncbi:aspartate ammonia-lyase [Candidatus Uhrbacteria bacterium]|nr:aspartate ammonia-lyase [Candidatus Uhrbacteria bacterium]